MPDSLINIFISYSHSDSPFVDRLGGDLDRQGYETWVDRRGLEAGQKWHRELEEAVNRSQVLLVVLSPDAVDSDYVRQEYGYAKEEGKVVIPLYYRPCKVPMDLRDIQYIDFQKSYDHGLAALVKALQREENRVLTDPLSISKHDKVSTAENRNRRLLLARVRNYWIDGVFEKKLYSDVLIALGLHEQHDAVPDPWQLILQGQHQAPGSLPSGTHITQVYDGVNGGLLILGEPGSGKTTLLLELTRDLLDRTQKDEALSIPVIFNLSSWAIKRQSLTQWLIEELNARYQIPRKVGQLWVENDQLLLLLDGLDEVASEYREACIDVINNYRREHGLVPMVVCSRRTEYLSQTKRLQLQSAVIVQPLTPEQIESYLNRGGEQLEALRQILQKDADLRALASTPLMLNVLTVVYQGMPTQEITASGSPGMKQAHVFDSYVQRMLTRRGITPRYPAQQTIQWLSWLAQQMSQRSQTTFYIERLQPDWLPDRWTRLVYRVSTGLIVGMLCLFVALLAGLILGVSPFVCQSIEMSQPDCQPTALLEGLGVGLVYGFVIGLVGGLIAGLRREITPAEKVTWSWKRVWQGFSGTGYVMIWLLSLLMLVALYSLYISFGSYSPVSSGSFPAIFIFLVPVFILIPPVVTGLRLQIKPIRATWSWQKAWLGFGGTHLIVFWLFSLLILVACDVMIYAFSISTSYSYPSSYLVLLVLLFILCMIIPIIIGLRIRLAPIRITWSWQKALWGCGSTGIVLIWLFFFLGFFSTGFPAPEIFILSALLLTLLVGLMSGLRIKLKPIRVGWAGKRALRGGLVVVCLPALLAALPIGLFVGLFFGLSGVTLEKSTFTRPNEGIRRSARNSILSAAIVALILGTLLIVGVLIIAPLTIAEPGKLPTWQSLIHVWIADLFATYPVAWPLIIIVMLIIGLIVGGLACLQHFTLRLFLQRKKFMPWNYPEFLDYAAERILLRKVGGGYIFLHRLVLDYFANLGTASEPDASVQSRQEILLPDKMLSAPVDSIEKNEQGDAIETPVPLLPCGHEWRPNARFCGVCGAIVQP